MVEKKTAKSSVGLKKTEVKSEEKGKKEAKKKPVVGVASSKKEPVPAVLKKAAKDFKETPKKVSVGEKTPSRSVKKTMKVESKKVTSKKSEVKSSNRKKAIAQERAKKHPQLTEETGIVVEQYRSAIRQPERQRKQLETLGLGKIGKKRVLPKIPVISKLVDRLKHLVRIVK